MPDTTSLSVKQQRDARRAEKVAQFQKTQKRQKLTKRIATIGGIAAGAGVLALVVGIIVTTAVPKPDPSTIDIAGLETFDSLGAVHIDPTPVDYAAEYGMNPPAGGNHFNAWLNCGIYTEVQANENAVHSLEHGAVWVTYDPAVVDEAGVNTLRDALPGTYVILSPFPDLPAPVVASAWGNQVQLEGVDDERLGDFVNKFWKSPDVPEPGAACVGAIDGPGRIA
ncbi:MAG: DUF3105 domain-containing protein [Microbacteriaceae bacterium]